MSIYQGNTKLRAYRGDCRPANIYLGDRKLTGWHEEAVSGTGQAELTDTYNDVTGGKLYGKAELAAPDPEPENPSILVCVKNPVITAMGPKGQQSFTIPSTLYALKDNHGYTVQDSLDLSQKKIIRQCGRYDFTGNEAWSAGTAAYNGENTTNRYLLSNLYGNYNVNAGELCTHLKRSIEQLWTKDYEGFTINAAQIHLRLPNALLGITPEDDSPARTAKFKTYLSKNRVSLIGKLKTPTEEPIDIPDIPSFYPATVVECTDENGNKVEMELIFKRQDG